MEKPLTYQQFKTGLTFRDVYYMIYNRKFKRRRGVLGYWRQLKLQMYSEYLRGHKTQTTYIVSDEEIPM